MTAALAPLTDETRTLLFDDGSPMPGYVARRVYVLPPGLPFDRWAEIGAPLQEMHASIQFWIGDWFNYGLRTYGDDAYQAVMDAAVEATGRGEESISQCAWVAASFPPGTRVTSLKYSHHRAALVDGLPIEEAHAIVREAGERKLPYREVARLAEARVQEIQAEALPISSEPATCAADAPWVPALSDLLPEWRDRLSEQARGKPEGYVQGWLDCLVATGNEACFAFWGRD